MTRDRWEQILFANVGDEVVQDMLNQYVLELEAEKHKLHVLAQAMWVRIKSEYPHGGFPDMGLLEGELRWAGIDV